MGFPQQPVTQVPRRRHSTSSEGISTGTTRGGPQSFLRHLGHLGLCTQAGFSPVSLCTLLPRGIPNSSNGTSIPPGGRAGTTTAPSSHWGHRVPGTKPLRWQGLPCEGPPQTSLLCPQRGLTDALVTLRHRQLRVDPLLASCVQSCSSVRITGLCILPNISEAAQSFIMTQA